MTGPALPTPEEVADSIHSKAVAAWPNGRSYIAEAIAARDAEHAADRARAVDEALARVEDECERLAKVDPYELDPHTIDAVQRFVAALRKEMAR